MMDIFGNKKINELESETREAHGEADDAYVQMADLKKQVELTYGLLWIVGCDRSTKNGNALYLARKALYEQLDKAGQARGIDAARKHLEANPYVAAPSNGDGKGAT